MKMIIRTLKPHEAERIHELFKSASVTRADLNREKVPNSGFYEYPLTAEDISVRLKEPQFCFALENGKDILAYTIAYQLKQAHENPELTKDPVLISLQGTDQRKIYLDQFFLRPGLPLFLAGRFLDGFDYVLQGEKIPEVVGVIAEKPWKNTASMRLAVCRGFSRKGTIDEGNVKLGIFSKLYYEVTK